MSAVPGDRSAASRTDRIQGRRERRLLKLSQAERTVPISFSIVGVQKAATSSLYRMLVTHPGVAGGPEKEIRFFSDEDRDWSAPDYSDYARAARKPSVAIAGDATPAYFFWPKALERMHRYDPSMRLLVTLRDPIERAVSQWSMERSYDPEFPNLPESVDAFADDTLPPAVPAGMTPGGLRRQALFTRGLYGQQLRRGLALFPRDQWLVLDFLDVFARSEATLDAVTDFLGLDRFTDYPPVLHSNQTPSDHSGRPITVGHIERLVELYRPDLAELTELSGLDTSRWSTSRVIAGELGSDELADKINGKLGLSTR